MEIAVVALQTQGTLSKETLETLFSAVQIKEETAARVSVWLVGWGLAAAVAQMSRFNVDSVICAEHQMLKDYIAENYLDVLRLINESHPSALILFPGNIAGNELAVRLACRMHGKSVIDCSAIVYTRGNVIVERPAYSGNLILKYRLTGKPWYLSLRSSIVSMVKVPSDSGIRYPHVYTDFSIDIKQPEFIKSREITARFQDVLSDAKTVVVVGVGVGNREGIGVIEKFAQKIGAVIGGTRPVVQNAWLPLDRLVGQSGKVITPNLCIVIGASGATPLLAGIDKAKRIIAINSDANAPIFQSCDWGVVGDFRPIITWVLEHGLSAANWSK